MVHALMKNAVSDSVSLTLTRIFVLNEIFANSHYAAQALRWVYFKSRKGSPIDLVWSDIPIKIITSTRQTGWEERAVEGARRAIKGKAGLLVGPTDHVTFPKNKRSAWFPGLIGLRP